MFLDRVIGVLRLNVDTYEEIEADETATSQAAIVVAIVAIIGGLLGGATTIFVGGSFIGTFLQQLLTAFIGWFIWAYVTYFVGTNLFKGTADVGELLRTLGYASSPRVLGILGFIPCVGWLIALASGIWALVAAIVAVRQALDFDDTVKAIITVVIGWVIILIIQFVLFAILGTVFGIGAASCGVHVGIGWPDGARWARRAETPRWLEGPDGL